MVLRERTDLGFVKGSWL